MTRTVGAVSVVLHLGGRAVVALLGRECLVARVWAEEGQSVSQSASNGRF